MKSKTTGRVKIFRMGMEEWEESDDEEWGGGVLERSEVVLRREEQRVREERDAGEGEKEVALKEGEVEGEEKLPKSLSALKQAWREEEKREWKKMRRRSSVVTGLRSINPCQPGPSFNKHLHSLSRRNTTLLSRLVSTSTTWAPPNGFSTPLHRSDCVSVGRRRRGRISCLSAGGMQEREGS
jgi:hypothetical protein